MHTRLSEFVENLVIDRKKLPIGDENDRILRILEPDAVVLCLGIRTPICKANKGSFKSMCSDELLSSVLSEVVKRIPHVPLEALGEVMVGTCLQPGGGQAMARMAAFEAGFPYSVPVATINRQCASGLQAIASVADAIRSQSFRTGNYVQFDSNSTANVASLSIMQKMPSQLVHDTGSHLQCQLAIAAGVESMSTCSFDEGTPIVNWTAVKKSRLAAACMIPMGITSENIAKLYGITRQEMDAYALESHRRADAAQKAGHFEDEILPISDVKIDGGIRSDCTAKSLAALPTVFLPEFGTTTAGNSSQTSDGAAAVLLASEITRQQMNLPLLCVWRHYVVVGTPPEIMGVGPAYAIPALLHKACLTVADIDVFEINEAFASQAIFCVRMLGLDPAKVNPYGGAIALGHPLGCSGTRLVVTCAHYLRRRNLRYGVVSLCVGTGMGAAALIENPAYTAREKKNKQETPSDVHQTSVDHNPRQSKL